MAWVDNRLEHWKFILSINDPLHLNDVTIKAMAHADQIPYEQRWYSNYRSADEIEAAILDGTFFKQDELVADDVREEAIDDFVAELARYVVRNDIMVSDSFITEYEMIYMVVMRDMSYITNMGVSLEGMEAMEVIKSSYDDWYSTFLAHPRGLYESELKAVRRCIEHLRNDSVKLIFTLDDVFNMKELESLEGDMEV